MALAMTPSMALRLTMLTITITLVRMARPTDRVPPLPRRVAADHSPSQHQCDTQEVSHT